MTLDPRSPEWQQIYEFGESNMQADYMLALDDVMPDDVDVTPTAVAERMKALTNALRALLDGHGDDPGSPTQDGGSECFWCDAYGRVHAEGERPNRRVWTTYDHTDDCPWVAARALLGPPKPESEGDEPTPSLFAQTDATVGAFLKSLPGVEVRESMGGWYAARGDDDTVWVEVR